MTRYFNLIIRCPPCLEQNLETGPAGAWYHASCGGAIQVGDDAMYRCTSCSDTRHVQQWRYACMQHEADYRPTASGPLASAISTAAQITSVAGRQWLMTFLENLGDW